MISSLSNITVQGALLAVIDDGVVRIGDLFPVGNCQLIESCGALWECGF